VLTIQDDYLLRYESGMRKAENDIRRQARNALAREGIIATEGEIRKWRDQNKDIVDAAEPMEPVR
jgi:plasmid stabilization system protein ParE